MHSGATTITEEQHLDWSSRYLHSSAAADENILKAKIFRAGERKIIGGD